MKYDSEDEANTEFIEYPVNLKSLARRSTVYGIGIVDVQYKTSFQRNGKQIVCPFYAKWVAMLERCYSPALHIRHPTYIDCSVTASWLTFSNFKNWMEQQDWKGKHLDKDLLVKGNKVYSPETCIFISPRLNGLLIDSKQRRGNFKLGVTYAKRRNKYQAQCNDGNKPKNLGYFKTEDEAHIAYLKFKKELILEIAEEQTTQKLKQALITLALSYTLEI